MDTNKRQATAVIVVSMNLIPLAIAVYTLWLIIVLSYKPITQLTLDGIIEFVWFVSLPILGIITYVLSFVYSNTIGSKKVWLLGCINSGIWAVIFLGIFLFQLFTNPFISILSFVSLIYFGYLFHLNQKMAKYMKLESLIKHTNQ